MALRVPLPITPSMTAALQAKVCFTLLRLQIGSSARYNETARQMRRARGL
jgi:hypothetical protein